MFVGLNSGGTIYGIWTCRQPDDADHPRIEALPDNHPDVVAFLNRPQPPARDLVDQIRDLPPARLAALRAELAKP